MNIQLDTTRKSLRELVLENFTASAVFERYGLDFCCRGNTTLRAACDEAGLDVDQVASELEELEIDANSQRYFRWDVGFLADYIVNNHHSFVHDMIPMINLHLDKVLNAHGERHPEFFEIAELFRSTASELEHHMMKEEKILFPAIKVLAASHKANQHFSYASFGSIANPISILLQEHESAGEDLARIRALLNDYIPPTDACTTMRLLYQEFEAFEQDLHKHVFLENSLLFPKAIRLEKELEHSEEAVTV